MDDGRAESERFRRIRSPFCQALIGHQCAITIEKPIAHKKHLELLSPRKTHQVQSHRSGLRINAAISGDIKVNGSHAKKRYRLNMLYFMYVLQHMFCVKYIYIYMRIYHM